MAKKIFTTFAFMLLTFFAIAQRANNNSGLSTTAAASPQKTEAKNFGLSLMKAYFNGDCNFVYSKIALEISVFEGGAKVKKVQFSAQDICSEVSINEGKTYNDYLNNYDPEVLSAAEFGSKFPAYQSVLQLREGDFYFGGNKLKAGGSELFLSHDHTRFVLRRLGTNVFQIVSF
jgi:hypothetical protein